MPLLIDHRSLSFVCIQRSEMEFSAFTYLFFYVAVSVRFSMTIATCSRNRGNGPQSRSLRQTAFRKLMIAKNLVLTSRDRTAMILLAKTEVRNPNRRGSSNVLRREARDSLREFASSSQASPLQNRHDSVRQVQDYSNSEDATTSLSGLSGFPDGGNRAMLDETLQPAGHLNNRAGHCGQDCDG